MAKITIPKGAQKKMKFAKLKLIKNKKQGTKLPDSYKKKPLIKARKIYK
jgi:hypothetical protein